MHKHCEETVPRTTYYLNVFLVPPGKANRTKHRLKPKFVQTLGSTTWFLRRHVFQWTWKTSSEHETVFPRTFDHHFPLAVSSHCYHCIAMSTNANPFSIWIFSLKAEKEWDCEAEASLVWSFLPGSRQKSASYARMSRPNPFSWLCLSTR